LLLSNLRIEGRCLPRRRRVHQATLPPRRGIPRCGGEAEVCRRLWPDLVFALMMKAVCSSYPKHLLLFLRARALAPGRCRSRPPRTRLRCRVRRMIEVGEPRTRPPPLRATPRLRWDSPGFSHRGQRGRPVPHSTRGFEPRWEDQAWAPNTAPLDPAATRRSHPHACRCARHIAPGLVGSRVQGLGLGLRV
jgi:hypothetical protein